MRACVLLIAVGLLLTLASPVFAQDGENFCTDEYLREISFVTQDSMMSAEYLLDEGELSEALLNLEYAWEWLDFILLDCWPADTTAPPTATAPRPALGSEDICTERYLRESIISAQTALIVAEYWLDEGDMASATVEFQHAEEWLKLALRNCGTMADDDASSATATPAVPAYSGPPLLSPDFLDDTSLVTNDPCAAPCWNYITPGETTWDEALAILEDDPRFSNIETDNEREFLGVDWQKAGTDLFCCRMVANDTTEVVEFLFLSLSPQITLDRVLAVHGEPTYTIAQTYTQTAAIVQLLYPDTPMIIWVVVDDTRRALAPDSDVVALFYMTDEQMALVIDTTVLYGWAGYQSYEAYQDAAPVVTPAMTLTLVPGR